MYEGDSQQWKVSDLQPLPAGFRRRAYWARKKPPGVAGRLGVDLSKYLRPLSPTPADAQQAEGHEGEGRGFGCGVFTQGNTGDVVYK